MSRLVQGVSLPQAQAMLGSQAVAAAAAQLLGQASRLLPGSAGSYSLLSVTRTLATAAQRLALVDACSTRLVLASGRDVSLEGSQGQVLVMLLSVMACACRLVQPAKREHTHSAVQTSVKVDAGSTCLVPFGKVQSWLWLPQGIPGLGASATSCRPQHTLLSLSAARLLSSAVKLVQCASTHSSTPSTAAKPAL